MADAFAAATINREAHRTPPLAAVRVFIHNTSSDVKLGNRRRFSDEPKFLDDAASESGGCASDYRSPARAYTTALVQLDEPVAVSLERHKWQLVSDRHPSRGRSFRGSVVH